MDNLFLAQGRSPQLVSSAFRNMACHESLDKLGTGIMRRVAEREGFEPSIRLLGIYSLSRRAPSADSAISPENSEQFTVYSFQLRIKPFKSVLTVLDEQEVQVSYTILKRQVNLTTL